MTVVVRYLRSNSAMLPKPSFLHGQKSMMDKSDNMYQVFVFIHIYIGHTDLEDVVLPFPVFNNFIIMLPNAFKNSIKPVNISIFVYSYKSEPESRPSRRS